MRGSMSKTRSSKKNTFPSMKIQKGSSTNKHRLIMHCHGDGTIAQSAFAGCFCIKTNGFLFSLGNFPRFRHLWSYAKNERNSAHESDLWSNRKAICRRQTIFLVRPSMILKFFAERQSSSCVALQSPVDREISSSKRRIRRKKTCDVRSQWNVFHFASEAEKLR